MNRFDHDRSAGIFYNNNSITYYFSEETIIDLQDKFLTPGLHTIIVPNVIVGRTLIVKILKSLNYYHTIGCLSETALESDAIFSLSYYQETTLDNILTECFYDFIWIECTKKFIQSLTLYDEKKFYTTTSKIPIIAVAYQEAC